jgi:hypothetical protein
MVSGYMFSRPKSYFLVQLSKDNQWTYNLMIIREYKITILFVCIREMSGSNLDGETDYSDRDFRSFSQSLKANAWIVPGIRHNAIHVLNFQFIIQRNLNIRRKISELLNEPLNHKYE